MLATMRVECYSDDLCQEFERAFVDTAPLFEDLRVTGVLGECLI